MAAPTLPAKAGSSRSRSSSSKKKTTTRKTSTTKRRLGLAAGRTKQITQAAITTGEIVGSGAAASALAGWRGNAGLKLGPVDGRLIAGLGAMVAGMWNKTTNAHLVNIGIGVLGSWVHEQAFEMGSKWAGSKATATSEGVIIGDVDDDEEDGVAGPRRRARRLARLSRKIARLKARRARISGRGGAALPGPGMGQGGPSMVTVPAWAVRPQYRRQFA